MLISSLVWIAFASVALFAQEPKRISGAAASANNRLALSRSWPFFAITIVSITAYSIVQQVVALRLQDALGFSSDESIAKAGLALMATALAMIVVQGGVLRIVTCKPEMLLGIGAVFAAFSMLLSAFARSYAELFVALIMLGAALGLMLPGNLASLSLRTGAGAQGKAAGLNVVGQGLGLALGPLSGAALHQISPRAPFLAAAILMLIASTLAIHVWCQRGFPVAGESP